MKIVRRLTIAVLSIVLGTNVNATPSSDLCRKLAGTSWEPLDSAQSDNPIDRIDGLKAAEACQAAMREQPNAAQPKFRYVRALLAQKKYDEARELAEQVANAGYAPAMLTRGTMFANGWGEQVDWILAVFWWKKAAEANLVPAQTALGALLLSGNEVARNYYDAAKWNQLAASAGDSVAQGNMGLQYINGWGVEQNAFKGVMLLNEASAKNNCTARYYLVLHHSAESPSSDNNRVWTHHTLSAKAALAKLDQCNPPFPSLLKDRAREALEGAIAKGPPQSTATANNRFLQDVVAGLAVVIVGTALLKATQKAPAPSATPGPSGLDIMQENARKFEETMNKRSECHGIFYQDGYTSPRGINAGCW